MKDEAIVALQMRRFRLTISCDFQILRLRSLFTSALKNLTTRKGAFFQERKVFLIAVVGWWRQQWDSRGGKKLKCGQEPMGAKADLPGGGMISSGIADGVLEFTVMSTPTSMHWRAVQLLLPYKHALWPPSGDCHPVAGSCHLAHLDLASSELKRVCFYL